MTPRDSTSSTQPANSANSERGLAPERRLDGRTVSFPGGFKGHLLVLEPGGEWKLLGKLPMSLSSPAAAIIGGKLYAAGGSATGRGAQAKMWVADLP